MQQPVSRADWLYAAYTRHLAALKHRLAHILYSLLIKRLDKSS